MQKPSHVDGSWLAIAAHACASDTARWLLSHDRDLLITYQLPSLSFSLICCKLCSTSKHWYYTRHTALLFTTKALADADIDPASAIGVAAATVQFFAVGIKAIRLGKQICASKTGSTEANEALEVSLKAMSDIRKDL